MMYKQDYVVFRNGGIWIVTAVHGNIYTLCRNDDSLEVDDSKIVRKAITKTEMLDIIDRIPYIRTIHAPNNRTRRELYEIAMSKFDEVEWISVIKTVYLRKQECPLTEDEAAFGRKAEDFFHSEAAVILNIPKSSVEEYIASAVANDSW